MTYTRLLLTALLAVVMTALPSHAQQLPNNGFEGTWVDCTPWTDGNGKTQIGKNPPSWQISHVMGVTSGILGGTGKKAMGESSTGHDSEKSVRVYNDETGALGITRIVPGYVTLGTPWSTAEGTKTSTHDGGTWGGISFSYRPDAISLFYKFTSNDSEPASFIAYLWTGSWSQEQVPVTITTSGSPKTTAKMANRDRNIIFGAEAPTTTGGKVTASADAKLIGLINITDATNTTEWTSKLIEFEYESEENPEMLNIIFSANDYFNTKTATKGNSLTVDDVKLIYYSRLESLSVGGVPVPGFSSDKFEYDLTDTAFPTNTTAQYTILGGGQSATVGAPQIDKASSTIKITITGVDVDTDGKKTHTYTLRYKPFKAELSKVKINGTEYMVSGNNIVISTPWIDGMNVEPIVNTDCSGTPKAVFDAASKTITVTNEAASLKNTYTLTFAQPSYSKLQSLSVAGVAVPGFNPDKFDYDLTTTKFPEDPTKVTAIPMSEGRPATVGAPVVDRENATIKIKVTSADKESENTYTLKYMPFKAELSKVKINGTEYNATSNSINISTPWVDGMTVEPIVNTNCSGTPKAVFDAASKTITVTNEAASLKNTYTLTFAQPSYSKLQSLSVAGVAVPGFNPDKFDYDLTTTKFPEDPTKVTAVPMSEGKPATVGAPVVDWKNATIKIIVTSADNESEHTYTLKYMPFKAELSKVKINGTEYNVNGTTITIGIAWSEEMIVEPMVNSECSGSPKAVFDPITKKITVTNVPASLTKTYTLIFEQPYYSRISSITIGDATYIVSADGKTVDATSLPLPMPENESITVNILSGGQGKPTVTAKNRWVRDTEKGTVTFTVTNSEPDTDGAKSHTYTIQFPTPVVSRLKNIGLEAEWEPEFSPTVYDYRVEAFTPATDDELLMELYPDCNITPSVERLEPDGKTQTVKITLKGDGPDFDGKDQHSYTIVFNTPSDEYRSSLLTKLSVKGIAIEPFSPRTYRYSVSMPIPENITHDDLDVEFYSTETAPNDGTDYEIESVDINKAVARIRVFNDEYPDESGAYDHTYIIQFLPYYSRLNSISIGEMTEEVFTETGENIEVHFAIKMPAAEEIVLTLPEKTAGNIAVGQITMDQDKAIAMVTVSNDKPDTDGLDKRTYTLCFAMPHFSRLASITIDGDTIPEFNPNTYSYQIPYVMPENPQIEAVAMEGGQGTPIVSEPEIDTENNTVTITVTNTRPDTDGENSHTYVMTFMAKPTAKLAAIAIDGVDIKDFNPDIYDYTLTGLIPAAENITATILPTTGNITEPTITLNQQTATATITVTNGELKGVYTLRFELPCPTTIEEIKVAGVSLDKFNPETLTYEIEVEKLPAESDITVTLTDNRATATVTLNDDSTRAEIKVTSPLPAIGEENTKIYQILFLPYYSRLNSISIGEMTEEVFTETGENIEVHFAIKMPAAEEIVLTLPEKTAGNIAVGQITMDQDKAIAMVTVSNDKPDTDGLDKRTYTLCFAMPHFSRLASITIDGDTIPEFNPNTYSYQIPYVMPENPQIEAVAMEGGQGTPIVSEPEIDTENNTVTITVTNTRPDTDGENSHTYVMTFMAKPTAKLAAIAIDGVDIKDFNPDIYDYTLTGLIPAAENITATILPTTGNITEPTITLNQQTATATITVTNGELKGVYTLRFELPCPTTIEEIKVAGVSLDKFNPETLTYEIEVEKLPAESDITVTLTDNRATATVTLNDDSTRAEIKVTSPLPAIGEENTKIYTLIFSIIPDNTGEPDEPQTPEKPDKPQKPENPTPSDNTITYGGMLTIMMMGEDLTNGGQEARVEIEDGEEGLCTFRLPDFSLDLGDGPASLGDIVVENVKVTTAADGARTYEGEVKGMELAEGAIIADVTLTGTADASGKAHMVIKVNWEGIDIDVEFNGQAEEKPEVPVTPAPADGTTIYNGMLTIMMMGEDLTKGGQEARVEIEDGEEGLCTFRLPDFSLDLGDGPASLGDIVVENVKVTTAPDGSKTFEGNVEGMELAEGAIIADVTLSGTADSEGMAQMVIKVNWEGIDIDVEFNGQAEEKPEVPVTPTPGDGVWDLTEGIITVEMNGYDITEGGTPATLHTARMDDGKYTFMVPDFMLALDADNTPANLGDIVVNGITASQLSGSLTRYTGTVDNLSLAGGSIAANASIDGTIAADGTTVINVDVEWIMEDGRHVPIMVRFTNTPRSNNTAEDESYSGVMTAEIEGEPIRTFGVLLRISPHSPGRCNMTIEGFDFSPASRAAGLGHTINIPGVCVTPLADGMTGYDGNTSGISVSAGITVDAILHGFTTETGHHSLSLDLLWAEQGVRIAGTFDGHIDVTAIDAPGSDRTDNDENAEWYNMQGIRVNGANLRPGVYIKRTATKTEKIIISE